MGLVHIHSLGDLVMNKKRIEVLAKQAYKDVIKHTPSMLVTKEQYEQKFAELLIGECAAQLEIEYGSSELSGNEAAALLRKRFGVK